MMPSLSDRASRKVISPPIACRVLKQKFQMKIHQKIYLSITHNSSTFLPTPQKAANSSIASLVQMVESTSKQTQSALRQSSFSVSMLLIIILVKIYALIYFLNRSSACCFLLSKSKNDLASKKSHHYIIN